MGQVYKARLPGVGDVAVKVQRPGVRLLVEVRKLHEERRAGFIGTVHSVKQSEPRRVAASKRRPLSDGLFCFTRPFKTKSLTIFRAISPSTQT